MPETAPAQPPKILLADDQEDILRALRLLLKSEGFVVRSANGPAAVLDLLKREEFDAALIDLNYARDTTSGQEGLALVQELRELDPQLPVVVMTAWATIDLAVACMREGARDFIQKPWENARLLTILRNQVELRRALAKTAVLAEENRALKAERRAPAFIAEAPSMRPILEMIERVGPSDANVLITGENGTGKGVVAQALHARSPRADGPFVSVNMGGLPEGVFESEMFGHVKGAFTDAKADRAGRFEMADGGTLFLDEMGNMPLGQQAKLLRLLETGEYERVGSSKTRRVNVRLISATNADLTAEVQGGRFRQDLLFRLNTIHLHLPPLRERREDIPRLAQHFLRQHARRYRRDFEGFAPAALRALESHPWPGNVRELDHALERAVLLAKGTVVQPDDLGLRAAAGAAPSSLDDMSLEEVEVYLIQRTMTRHGGSATKAAEALGLSRSAFYRRLQRYGL